MFKNFGKKLEVVGLNALRIILYIIGTPVLGILLASTILFVGILILYAFLTGAFSIAALANAAIQIWMALAAIFWPNIWSIMANMWSWLWHIFADGIIFFWPYLKGSILPVFVSLGVMTVIHTSIKRLSAKIATIKLMINPH